METENVKLIGDYLGVPVYYDKNSTNPNTFYRARGPIPEHKDRNNVGVVWVNFKTGKATLPNGEPYVSEKVDYETKSYIMGTDNIEKAKELIDKLIDKELETVRNK